MIRGDYEIFKAAASVKPGPHAVAELLQLLVMLLASQPEPPQ